MMGKILRYLTDSLSLLRQGRFFLLFQSIVTKLVPERWIGLKKSVFFRLERRKGTTKRDSGDMTVFCGDADSVPRLVRDLYNDTETAREFYADYYRKGAEPWLAELDGKIIGVTWFFTGSYLLPWEGYDAWLLDVEVEPAAKFAANGLVAPECRGRGVFTHILEHCFDAYPDAEFYSCVDESNIPSIKSHDKIGFRRCGVVYLIRFFGGTRCLFLPKKGKSRFLKLSRGAAAPVSLLPCKRD